MNTEKKHDRDRYHRGIRTVLMLILAAVFLFSLYKVVSILKEYKEINDFYDKTEELYTANIPLNLNSAGAWNSLLRTPSFLSIQR